MTTTMTRTRIDRSRSFHAPSHTMDRSRPRRHVTFLRLYDNVARRGVPPSQANRETKEVSLSLSLSLSRSQRATSTSDYRRRYTRNGRCLRPRPAPHARARRIRARASARGTTDEASPLSLSLFLSARHVTPRSFVSDHTYDSYDAWHT